MKKDKLIELLRLGEDQQMEFKTICRTQVVGREVCAFLNSKGGYIVCGIGSRGEIVGIRDTQLAKGHLSVLRNPDIAHVLYLRGMMEKNGRGSLLIQDLCEEQQIPAPEWKSDPNLGVTLTFHAPEDTAQVTGQVKPRGKRKSSKDLNKLANALGLASAQVTAQVTAQVENLLKHADGKARSRDELQSEVGLTHREHFRKAYMEPLITAEWLERTIPDKPRSSKQKYRLTNKGRAWLREGGEEAGR